MDQIIFAGAGSETFRCWSRSQNY